MIRVTRPGGMVVVAEADQESLVIAVPGVSSVLCDRVKMLRRDIAYRNDRLASRLPELFIGLGLVDVWLEAFPLVFTDPDDAFGLPAWPRLWRETEVAQFSEAELSEWDIGMSEARQHGGLVYSLTFFVVAGRPRGHLGSGSGCVSGQGHRRRDGFGAV